MLREVVTRIDYEHGRHETAMVDLPEAQGGPEDIDLDELGHELAERERQHRETDIAWTDPHLLRG